MADKENFPVHITAVDGFTKVLQGIRNKLGGFGDSFTKAGKAMTALKRDSGWTSFTSELATAKDNAMSMAGSIANILTPLGAVAGGLSLASVRGFSSEFALYSRNIDMAAKRTNFAVDQIQSLGSVAKIAGMNTDNLSDEVVHFDQVTRGAIYNNPEAMGMFTKMGVPLIAGGTPGSPGYKRPDMAILKDLAASYKHMVDEGRGSAAEYMIQSLGLGYWTPALSMGREGIQKSEQIQQQYGFKARPEEIEGGKDLFFAEQKSSSAWDSLKKSIAVFTDPVFTDLNTQMATWMKHQADSRVLGQEIGSGFRTLATDVGLVARGFEQAGEKMGIWKNDGDAIVKLIEFGMVAAIAQLTISFLRASAVFAASPLGRFLLVGGAGLAAFEMIYNNQSTADSIDKSNPAFGDYLQEHGVMGAAGNAVLVGFHEMFTTGLSTIGHSLYSAMGGNPDFSYKDLFAGKYGGPQTVDVNVNFTNAPPGTTATFKTAGAAAAPAKVVHDSTGHF